MSSPPIPSLSPLCTADDATFWPWRTWTDFARMSPAERAGTTVIVPVAGFTDWGLGHPLDLEEVVLTQLLKAAIVRRPANFQPLVIPPLRFVLGPAASSAFTVDPPTAHAFLREVAASIHATGFQRMLFFNASPWNEELCAAASRDLRIEFGLQIFRMNLSMLGLDLHPVRSSTRRKMQTLMTSLTGREPEALTPPLSGRFWADERIQPLAGEPVPLAEAMREGSALLAATAERVAGLFGDIAQHPALPHAGKLLTMTPP